MKIIILFSLLSGISSFADDKVELRNESISLTAPLAMYLGGNEDKTTLYRDEIFCSKKMGKVECKLDRYSLSCKGELNKVQFSTQDGDLRVKRFDVATGFIRFEYGKPEDLKTCQGTFSDEVRKTFLRDFRKFRSFSCQAVLSVKDMGSVEWSLRLRPERKISEVCPDLSL